MILNLFMKIILKYDRKIKKKKTDEEAIKNDFSLRIMFKHDALKQPLHICKNR